MTWMNRKRGAAAAATAAAVAVASVELLEARQLFASVTLAGGVLTLTGDAATPNSLAVSVQGSQYKAVVNGVARWYGTSGVTKIRLVGGSVGDLMTLDASVKIGAIVEGGAGNDTVVGGAGNDTILGFGGNDSLDGGAGNDQIFGGDGNDVVNGSAGNDTVFGDAGDDTVDGGTGSNVALGGSGTNTVANDLGVRALPSPTGPVLDVRNYGAVLNGKANDSAAINRAIAALPATGGTVVISGLAGIGGQGINLSGRSNVRLIGQGTGAGIKLLDVPTVQGYGQTGMLVVGSTDSSVENLVFDGNGQSCSPLTIWKNTRVTVSGCTFKNGNGPGSLFAIGNQSNQYLNNTVQNSMGSCRGLWIGNTNAGDADVNPLISGNVISGTKGTGVGGTANGARVIGNRVTGAKGAGIALGGASGAHYTNSVIAENVCTGNGFHGIQADNWAPTIPIDNMVIANNVCSGNLNSGIYAVHVRNWTVVGNTCNDNNSDAAGSGAGVLVSSATGVVVAANTLSDTRTGTLRTQTQGVSVEAWNSKYNNSSVDILYNTVSGNREGISLANATNSGSTGVIDLVRVAGNTATGNTRYGLYLWQVKPSTITNVTQSENSYGSNLVASVTSNVP